MSREQLIKDFVAEAREVLTSEPDERNQQERIETSARTYLSALEQEYLNRLRNERWLRAGMAGVMIFFCLSH